MATAKTETLIPLDRAAQLCGIHPLHFNQIVYSPDGRAQGCGEVWLQYDWQRPSLISRESFALAIAQAEYDLEIFLGFPIYPKWYKVRIPINGTPVVLPKAYFIEAGVPKRTKIGTLTITPSDEDSDGYKETATIDLSATPGIPANELEVYYPGETTGWQIRPIKVKDDTIILSRHQLLKQKELEQLTPTQIGGDDDTKFLTEVDVYRVVTDKSVNATLYGPCNCGSTCAKCEVTATTACMTSGQHKDGIVDLALATWNTTTSAWVANSCVDTRVRYGELNFRAGWTQDPIWDEAVIYLALSRLSSGLCACPTVKTKLEWWSTDTAHTSREEGSYKIPKFMEFCPWGYTRGAMYAYSIAWKYKMPQGA